MGKYKKLASELKLKILNGTYEPGERLPSIRMLSEQFQCNPNTMYQALSLLRLEGLLTSERTVGYYITTSSEKIDKVKQDDYLKDFYEMKNVLLKLGYSKEELEQFTDEKVKMD